MREIKYIFILALVLLACRSKNDSVAQSITTKEPKTWKSDSILTKEGNFYQFIFLDSNNYKIRWGNKDRVFQSEKTFEVISKGFLLNESSKDAIFLTQGCGTSCTMGVVLLIDPKTPTSIKEYMFVKAIEINKGLVAYVNQDEKALITIENFTSGKQIVLENLDLCPAAFKGDCIDSSGFKGSQFFIKWQGNRWERGKKDSREKIVSIAGL